ncbi:ATP-binding cassette domain-containing protein [Ferrimonas gelatinilytica]|uniref:ATP-binding cassette domain-containing protein n=1 Tax=Ferrimonas gelatinilytica TaxID=1255257 RepID=A0ABP9S1E1_9GAMM
MIEIEGLSKRFALADPKRAAQSQRRDPRQRGRHFYSVESVSLSCPAGEVLGLIGPNGAGKTTTLRLLSGVLRPDAGRIVIDGEPLDTRDGELRRRIGFLSASTALYERLTVEENLRYFGQLYGMTVQALDERIALLQEQLAFSDFRHRRVMDLSSGMRQRANIARAVIHQPRAIVLDEPTTGLDIMATEVVLQFIDQQRQSGVPVIFSTHHLEEICLLCDRLAVMQLGRTVFNGPLEAYAGSRDLEPLRRTFMAQALASREESREVGDAQAHLA